MNGPFTLCFGTPSEHFDSCRYLARLHECVHAQWNRSNCQITQLGTSLDRYGEQSYQLSVLNKTHGKNGTRGNTYDVCFMMFCVCLKASNLGLCKKDQKRLSAIQLRLCRKILFRSCLWPSERSQSPGLFIPRENWFRHAGSPRYGCFLMDTTMKMDDNRDTEGTRIYGDLMKPPLELFPQDLSKS